MGLEKVYRTLDVRPIGHPFKVEASYPASNWATTNRTDFQSDYVPGPRASLPKIGERADKSGNMPHGRQVYHIFKIDHKAVPAVKSKTPEETPDEKITTEQRVRYTTSSSFVNAVEPLMIHSKGRGSSYPKPQPARGIVPGTSLVPCSPRERLLPTTQREQAIKWTTSPFLQYSGKKMKLGQPYKDGGVFYNEEQSTPRRESGDKYWGSISSLTGNDFTRRRPLFGREPSLPVDGFNGGCPVPYPRSEDYRRSRTATFLVVKQ